LHFLFERLKRTRVLEINLELLSRDETSLWGKMVFYHVVHSKRYIVGLRRTIKTTRPKVTQHGAELTLRCYLVPRTAVIVGVYFLPHLISNRSRVCMHLSRSHGVRRSSVG
jgi:hypothetical protein